MFKSIEQVSKTINSHEVSFIDLCFTDFDGNLRHKVFSTNSFNLAELDGSNIKCDNLTLSAVLSTGFMNPFTTQRTISFICNTSSSNNFDWRSACDLFAKKGMPIGMSDFFYVTLQFSVFDSISFDTKLYNSFYKIECGNNSDMFGNLQCDNNKVNTTAGLAMLDDLFDLRSEIADTAQSIGINVVSHANGDSSSSAIISFKVNGLTLMADHLQLLKLVIVNTVRAYGKSVVFMSGFSKNENCAGITLSHCLSKNLIENHANSIVNLSSALCPFVSPMSLGGKRFNKKINWIIGKRIPNTDNFMCEYNFIDGICNPYGAIIAVFAAGKMGLGLDVNDIECTASFSDDLHIYSPDILPYSLAESLNALNDARSFALEFMSSEHFDIFLAKKNVEAKKILATINPIEFEFYYNS
ncbi:glutamine synthetase [Candidatus Xenohaliotis californiensis]|uniref:Glutamine synthetase n=1 Tax=Candidatus Xenohaliotis californiensis TaxID=84677 RepID=A0ABM9N8D8_9RICK|nr:glutamine synthetase [Candidatus Xenohaliotis californiensis]